MTLSLTDLGVKPPAESLTSLKVFVPDGSTVVVGGLRARAECRRHCVAESAHLLILVTARVIVREQEEPESLGDLRRIPR